MTEVTAPGPGGWVFRRSPKNPEGAWVLGRMRCVRVGPTREDDRYDAIVLTRRRDITEVLGVERAWAEMAEDVEILNRWQCFEIDDVAIVEGRPVPMRRG